MKSLRTARPLRHSTKRYRTARLIVLKASAWQGWLTVGPYRFRCAIGPAGVRARKREGDGATPRGRFELLAICYRADRCQRPSSDLQSYPIDRRDAWCDAPHHGRYNRPVRLPFSAGHERMWRDDPLYDLVIILDHNQRPRVRGHGSCVFMHIARAGYTPTAGCIALALNDLRKLLAARVTHIGTASPMTQRVRRGFK